MFFFVKIVWTVCVCVWCENKLFTSCISFVPPSIVTSSKVLRLPGQILMFLSESKVQEEVSTDTVV